MSAALLRKAATVLQTMALDADDSGSPWRANSCHVYGADGECIAKTAPLRAPGMYEASWIALMHPGIAQPLAAWLRAEAQSADNATAWIASLGKADDPEMAAKLVERHQHALAVALVILGEDA